MPLIVRQLNMAKEGRSSMQRWSPERPMLDAKAFSRPKAENCSSASIRLYALSLVSTMPTALQATACRGTCKMDDMRSGKHD